MLLLLPCGHSSCRPCLKRWFEMEETTGQTAPSCPVDTCRQPLHHDSSVGQVVLGRPFRPAGCGAINNNSSHGKKKKKTTSKRKMSSRSPSSSSQFVDVETQTWLEANTIECGGCQGRIMKSEGCDKLQCLCGYRICWKCKSVNASCKCSPGHVFLDNITGKPTGVFFRKAKIAKRHQLHDMKRFIEHKKLSKFRRLLRYLIPSRLRRSSSSSRRTSPKAISTSTTADTTKTSSTTPTTVNSIRSRAEF